MYAFLSPSRNTRKFAFIHRFFISFAIALVCFVFGNAIADARENSYPPDVSIEELTELVKKVPKTHPRLFIHADELETLRRKSEKNALNRSLKEAIVHQADVLLDDAPIERKLQGRRLLGQSRRCVQRVLALAMAYQLTEDAKYAERCKKEMLAAASFEDWNPSHFLDVAEMTFALAFGYDWLYDRLDEDSRLKIRDAIIHKGVELPFTTKHNGWVRSSNNWGQVCHGGLLAGAFAVLEDEPELAAKTAHSALKNVTRSMAAFAPKGSYPEGPGYWSYGTSYNVLLIGVLDSVLGSDFGLSLAPGFDRTGQYLSVVTGPSGMTFNYADGGAGRSAQPAVFWFASKFDRPDWSFHEYDLLAKAIDSAKRSNRSTGDRFFSHDHVMDGRQARFQRHQNAAALVQRRPRSHYDSPQFVDRLQRRVHRREGGIAVGQPRQHGYGFVRYGRRRRALGDGPGRGRLPRHRVARDGFMEPLAGFGPLDDLSPTEPRPQHAGYRRATASRQERRNVRRIFG